MVDWATYSDDGGTEAVSRRWRPEWATDKRLRIGTLIIFIIGLLLIIAGSIMLGIGISKSNQSCPVVNASPFYATVESTKITYQDVQNDYSHAADVITDQVRSALVGSSPKISMAAASTNTDPFITVLGMSGTPHGSVMAVVGMAYTTQDSPGATSLTKDLDEAPQLSLYLMSDSAASTPTQQMCTNVSTYDGSSTTTSTKLISSTTTSSKPTGTNPTSSTTSTTTTTTTSHPSTSTKQTTTTNPTTTTTTTTTTSTTTSTTPGISTSPKSTTGPTSTTLPTSTTTTNPSTTTTPKNLITTTTGCVWPGTTTTVPDRPGARDVVVLIDDSSAVTNSDNYNKITLWLSKQLFPLWPVSSERWEAAPVQYAEKEYNLLMDFDATSSSELSQSVSFSVFSGRNAPSITKALKSTLGLSGRQGVKRFVLLLSASSNLSDIETALPLAETIWNGGGSVITVALGGADGRELGMLSSGSTYTFSSDSFVLTNDQATEITDLIEGGQLTTTERTTVASTTPETVEEFPCHPDIAVVIDTSSAVPSEEEYQMQLSFVSEMLSPSWGISPSAVETEIVVYSTAYGGSIGDGAFNYDNWQQFAGIVHKYDYYYNHIAAPSISRSLQYLTTTESNRRGSRTPITLLITYSGNYDDVSESRKYLETLGNLIVISMGNNSEYLSSLSGNVLSGMYYGGSLLREVNSLICKPSSPVPLTSTTVTSPSTSTTTTSTTTTSEHLTSPTPIMCADCYPEEANILISMDTSSLMKGEKLDLLKSFVNNELSSSWNHAERLAVLSFDDKTHFDSPVDFGDLNTISEFHQIVAAAPQLPNPPSLSSAFQRALSNFHPLNSYGKMNTVIFTISGNDVQNAIPYANQLAQKGTVVIVGMEMADSSILSPLSPNIISWKSLNDTSGIAEKIEQYLNAETPSSTISSTATSVVSPSSTTTTLSPTSCERDIILLIDESNAFPSLSDFQKVQSWLVSSLIPQWDVSTSRISVAPFGFANKTWDDLGGDFLVNSQNELETIVKNNLVYRPKTGPSLTSGLKKATNVVTPRPEPATVVISASEITSDVSSAVPYATQLKKNGGIVITLALGFEAKDQLLQLSSGEVFSFSSTTYDVSPDIALEISNVLCSSPPSGPSTTAYSTATFPSTTSIPANPPFNCKPDVAFLFDNSGTNSNASEFNSVVTYTANSLIVDWIVDRTDTEAGLIFANANAGVVDPGAWQYTSMNQLRRSLNSMSSEYYGGQGSISNLLRNLLGILSSRRQTAPLSVLLFTFSSDYDDVLEAMTIANSINANIIAVAMGNSDPSVLGMLTGNVFSGKMLGDIVTDNIDGAMCNPLPATIKPTSSSSSTQRISSTKSVTTPAPTTSTEPVPMGCSDCFPSMSNLLILIDNSINQTSSTFNSQTQAASSLVSEWTHFERVALSSFASSLQTLISYNDLDKDELPSLLSVIGNLQQTNLFADLGKSLYMATGIHPDSDYGEQKTILFTTTASVSEKTNSAASILRGKGQLIVIAVDMTDPGDLTSIASSGDAVAWSNVSDTDFVVNAIMNALGSSTVPTNVPETGTTQTAELTTKATSPENQQCSQNLILLLDESNAIPSVGDFNQVKTWVMTSLIPQLPSTAVAPYGYADKDWNEITGGEFLADVPSLELLLNVSFSYKSQNGPNIARALQRAAILEPEGTVTTVLISASAVASDVAKAEVYANALAEKGAVVTLLLASNGSLSSLSSDSTLALTSGTYSPDQNIVNQIIAAICKPYTPTTVASTSTSTTTTTTTATTRTTSTSAPTTTSTSTNPTTTSTSPDTSTRIVTTSTTSVPSTITPDLTYVPSMADILFLFDVSSAVNITSLTAQKTLASALVSNWNHFERVGTMEFSLQPNSIAEFGDLLSVSAFNGYLQAVQLMETSANLSSALKFARKHYAIEKEMPGRNVVLFSASTDSAAAAQNAASALQNEGRVIVVSLGLTDTSPLAPLASPKSLVEFNDFSNITAAVSQINQLLGDDGSIVSSTTLKTALSSEGSTTTMPVACSTNFLLLLDESNAIPSQPDFDQLKSWIITQLLPSLPVTAVAPYGYTAKDWNQISGGEFLEKISDTEMLINISYVYRPQDDPSIARALQKASALQPYGTMTTLVVSASAAKDDVDKAAAYSSKLAQEGAVITLLIGGQGDLSPLASNPTLALKSTSFTPDQTVIDAIVTAVCSPYSTPSTTASTSTTSSSTTTTTSLPTTASSSTLPLKTTTSTSTSTSTTPSTTSTQYSTTKIVPDASFNPAMADIVILFDVSTATNVTTITAQKNLVLSLVSNWNHFERVAIMEYAAQANSISELGDFSSASNLRDYLQAVQPMQSPANLSNALKFVKKHYEVQSGMPGRNVILLSESQDSVTSAVPAATDLQKQGQMIVVSIALSDNNGLSQLASPGSLISFYDLDNPAAAVVQINNLLGETNSTVPSPETTILPISTSQNTPTAQVTCSENILILLDESNSIPSSLEFSELKTWVTTKLLPNLPKTAVDLYGYADKDWNPITGGSFLSEIDKAEMLINASYAYKPQNGPNIARAMQRAADVETDGSLTTLLISASAEPDDVEKAQSFAYVLKNKGNVVTLMLGTGDLSSIASETSLALNSPSFSPDDSIVAEITSAICTPYSAPTTTTTASTTTSTSKPTTTQLKATTTTTSSLPLTTHGPTSTGTTPSTPSITPSQKSTTKIVADASYSPSMADIVILFDVSTSTNVTTITAQKNLVLSLVSNWNHFERVAIMEYASQANSVSEFGDFSSASHLSDYLQAVQPMQSPANLSNALKFVMKHYGIQPGMPARNVILFSESQDSASAAESAAKALQNDGRVIVVSVALSDNSALSPIASPDSLVPFNDLNNYDATASQINQLLGVKYDSLTTTETVPSTILLQSSTTSLKSSTTGDGYYPWKADLLIVFDVSSATNTDKLNAQKSLVSALVTSWNHFERVALMDFSSNSFPLAEYGDMRNSNSVNDYMNALQLLNSAPNIAQAMKFITKNYALEDGMPFRNVVFLTSSTSGASDAQPYSDTIRSQGSLIIVSVGIADASALSSLATATVPFTDFSNIDTVASQINNILSPK